MLFLKKAIYYIARLVSWVLLIGGRVHKEANFPGPKFRYGALPKGFLCHETISKGRTYSFSVGNKVSELAPIAIKRRGLLGRWILKAVHWVGIRTTRNEYFEIAPMNEFVMCYVLKNEELLDNLKSLFYGHNRSWFKIKWLFSVSGQLWVETDFRLVSFQGHIKEDMEKISIKMSKVLKTLKRTPKEHWESWNPIRLMKINGFVNGLAVCAMVELVWLIVFREYIQTAELISLEMLMRDTMLLSLVTLGVVVIGICAFAQDLSTSVFALKYNYIKLVLSVFAGCCFILHDINCSPGLNGSSSQRGEVVGRYVSRSHRSGTSYNLDIILPDLNDSVSFRTRSKASYDALQKGDHVYVNVHEGALGYKWWDKKIYLKR